MELNTRSHFITGDIESGVDSKVYEGIIKTHAKEAITLLDYGLFSVTSAENEMIERVQFTECDILPFHDQDIPCSTEAEVIHDRKASMNTFSQAQVPFQTISDILVGSFGADAQGRRPYPSAGGLYPIEPLVFLFNEKTDLELESGCYHFRPVSKKLQPIQEIEQSVFFKKLLHGMIPENKTPAFCILYVAHLEKAIFKYRYRGYRHAVMECGSMLQQATNVAQKYDLRTTGWSSFGDHECLYALNLDPGVFLPITMQLFGYPEV